MGAALASLALAPAFSAALAALGLLAAGQGLATPSLSALTSRLAAAERQGAVLGVGQSLSAGARAFGPLAAGALYDLGPGLPYFVGGALAVAAGWLVAGSRPKA